MANIVVLTIGSRGDFQPYCAIARGLIEKGHSVTLASSPNFASFADRFNIPFVPIAGDFQQLLGSPNGLKVLEGNNVKFIEDEILWQQKLDAWKACQDSDLIVFSPITVWGYHIAEALKIPGILATPIPLSRTREFAFLKFTQRTHKRILGLRNLLSYRLINVLIWHRYAKSINRFRQDVLKLPRIRSLLGPNYRYSSGLPMPVIKCKKSLTTGFFQK